MKRNSLRIAGVVILILAAGCNRQDADALGRIGQILLQRAKAASAAGPQGKLVKGIPTALEGTSEEKEKDK